MAVEARCCTCLLRAFVHTDEELNSKFQNSLSLIFLYNNRLLHKIKALTVSEILIRVKTWALYIYDTLIWPYMKSSLMQHVCFGRRKIFIWQALADRQQNQYGYQLKSPPLFYIILWYKAPVFHTIKLASVTKAQNWTGKMFFSLFFFKIFFIATLNSCLNYLHVTALAPNYKKKTR